MREFLVRPAVSAAYHDLEVDLNTMIEALYEDLSVAYYVALCLRKRGFDSRDIRLIAKEDREPALMSMPIQRTAGSQVPEWPKSGELFEKLRGLFGEMTTISVQGIGPVTFAGPAFASIKGQGRSVDGLPVMLAQMGIWEDEVDILEEGIQRGHALLLVHSIGSKVHPATLIMRAFAPIRIEYHISNSPGEDIRTQMEMAGKGVAAITRRAEWADPDDTKPDRQHLHNVSESDYQADDGAFSLNESEGMINPG